MYIPRRLGYLYSARGRRSFAEVTPRCYGHPVESLSRHPRRAVQRCCVCVLWCYCGRPSVQCSGRSKGGGYFVRVRGLGTLLFPLRLSVFAVSPSHHFTVSGSPSRVPCPLRIHSPAHCTSRRLVSLRRLSWLHTRTHCIGYPHTHPAPSCLLVGWVTQFPPYLSPGQQSHRSTHISQLPLTASISASAHLPPANTKSDSESRECANWCGL